MPWMINVTEHGYEMSGAFRFTIRSNGPTHPRSNGYDLRRSKFRAQRNGKAMTCIAPQTEGVHDLTVIGCG